MRPHSGNSRSGEEFQTNVRQPGSLGVHNHPTRPGEVLGTGQTMFSFMPMGWSLNLILKALHRGGPDARQRRECWGDCAANIP